MEKFEYEILFGRDQSNVRGGVDWFLARNNQHMGYDLHKILNKLGGQGWEVITLGDIGFSPRSEIILKKRIG